jgi:nucleoid-associated protein YgaU
MALEKAKIRQLVPAVRADDVIEVLFNPTEYRVSKSNQFAEIAIPGLGAPMLQFGHGNAQTLSMQLFFDTYDPQSTDTKYPKNQDVRLRTRQVTDLLEIDGKLHAPPIIQFSWGNFVFVGVLQQADVRFNLFLPSGVPVRATVDVTIKQYYDGIEETGTLQSANYAKQHVVLPGDTLPGIAAKLYDDPAKWRFIADANKIDNPLVLETGRVLLIPAIE